MTDQTPTPPTQNALPETGPVLDRETAAFYGGYWHRYVPMYNKTREYMLETVRERDVQRALDAGCGHGVCSIVLSEIATKVDAYDIAQGCIDTARKVIADSGRTNISTRVCDLQALDAPDATYDLVWCWGVAMMAPAPERVFAHLARVTRPGGVIYLGVYLRTWLTPIHELTRWACRTLAPSGWRKALVLRFFASLTRLYGALKGSALVNRRDDNVSIEAQVEDWYYPPHKHFYTPDEIASFFRAAGFSTEVTQAQVGRMRSATIFVTRARRVSGSS